MTKILLFSVLFVCSTAFAQSQPHNLVRRLAVFPIQVPSDYAPKAEDVWWELREFMTRDKRFLVATKTLLIQQNVYLARGPLDPASAIILGKVVDADAIMTTYLIGHAFHMDVYETVYGRPLWKQTIELETSLAISDQLSSATLKIARDFMASIPYQGFVVVDALKNGPVYRDGPRTLFKADVGLSSEAEVGDPAELIHLGSDSIKPLFTTGAAVEVFAEGRIVKIEREIITVEVTRLTHASAIKEKSLVRLPKEQKRLEQLYAIADPLKSKVNPEFLAPEITTAKQEQAENKPLIASLFFIVNLTAFLFLAF